MTAAADNTDPRYLEEKFDYDYSKNGFRNESFIFKTI